jgi:hypothetical protein
MRDAQMLDVEISPNSQTLAKTVHDQCRNESKSPADCKALLIEAITAHKEEFKTPAQLLEAFRGLGRLVSTTWSSADSPETGQYLTKETIDQYSYVGRDDAAITSAELILCVSHYGEDLSWLNRVNTPFMVVSKVLVDNRILHVPVNRGNEVSSYLLYIVQYYDTLPQFTLFLHGHYEDWHQLYDVTYILRTIDLTKKYQSVNNYHVNDRNVTSNRYMTQLQSLWAELFQDELGDMPAMFREKCCAQFVVHRDRIRLRSKAFYQRLYAYVVSDRQDDAQAVDGYHGSMSYVVEYVWHYIFGEPAVMDYGDEAFVQLTPEIIVYV